MQELATLDRNMSRAKWETLDEWELEEEITKYKDALREVVQECKRLGAGGHADGRESGHQLPPSVAAVQIIPSSCPPASNCPPPSSYNCPQACPWMWRTPRRRAPPRARRAWTGATAVSTTWTPPSGRCVRGLCVAAAVTCLACALLGGGLPEAAGTALPGQRWLPCCF